MQDVTSRGEAAMYVVDSPHELARWRPLVNWVLYLPHGVIEYGLRSFAGMVFWVYWLMFVATGRLHPSLFGVLAMHERYNQRVSGYLVGFSEEYPPFDFTMGGTDNGDYPAISVTMPEPPTEVARTAAFNIVLAIPHYLVLALVGVAAFVVLIIGWFAVLISGRWPEGLRAFLVRVANYYLRVWCYVMMVRTGYPRFGL